MGKVHSLVTGLQVERTSIFLKINFSFNVKLTWTITHVTGIRLILLQRENRKGSGPTYITNRKCLSSFSFSFFAVP